MRERHRGMVTNVYKQLGYESVEASLRAQIAVASARGDSFLARRLSDALESGWHEPLERIVGVEVEPSMQVES